MNSWGSCPSDQKIASDYGSNLGWCMNISSDYQINKSCIYKHEYAIMK
jgi:hypothetical protein